MTVSKIEKYGYIFDLNVLYEFKFYEFIKADNDRNPEHLIKSFKGKITDDFIVNSIDNWNCGYIKVSQDKLLHCTIYEDFINYC